MNIFLNWKKGFFSNTYQIYNNGIQVGFLKLSTWSQKAKGVLKEREFEFITKGFLKQETTMLDSKTNSIIATISYNSWKSKAVIKKLSNEEYKWEFNNFWNTKWSLTNSYIFINYHGSTTKGEINSSTDDELLLITGLYISNYYWQRRASAVAAT